MRTHLLVLSALLSFGIAIAQPSGPMRFKVDRACDGNGSMCGARIYAEGQIEVNTPDRFSRFARANLSKLPPGRIVSLDSPGGSMFAGIKLGQVIRRLGFETQLLGGQVCASACALAFLGGVERGFEGDGKFGVHQVSSSSGSIGDGPTQITIVAVASYIESMGVDRRLLDVASLVPPNSIYWLTEQQRQQLRVDNSSPMYSDWILDSDQSGNTFTRATLLLAGDRLKVEYTLRRAGQDLLLRVVMTAPIHKADRLSTVHSVLEEESMAMTIDGRTAFESPPLRWRGANDTVLSTEVRLPRSLADALRGSGKVGFEFFIPNVASDMNPSVTLPSANLARYVATILK